MISHLELPSLLDPFPHAVSPETRARSCILFGCSRCGLAGSVQLRTRNVVARDCNPDLREKTNQFPSSTGCVECRRAYRPSAGVALATSRFICRAFDGVDLDWP